MHDGGRPRIPSWRASQPFADSDQDDPVRVTAGMPDSGYPVKHDVPSTTRSRSWTVRWLEHAPLLPIVGCTTLALRFSPAPVRPREVRRPGYGVLASDHGRAATTGRRLPGRSPRHELPYGWAFSAKRRQRASSSKPADRHPSFSQDEDLVRRPTTDNDVHVFRKPATDRHPAVPGLSAAQNFWIARKCTCAKSSAFVGALSSCLTPYAPFPHVTMR